MISTLHPCWQADSHSFDKVNISTSSDYRTEGEDSANVVGACRVPPIRHVRTISTDDVTSGFLDSLPSIPLLKHCYCDNNWYLDSAYPLLRRDSEFRCCDLLYLLPDPAFAVLGKRPVTTTIDQSALTNMTLSC